MATSRPPSPTSARMRSRISAAALLVNVTARICQGRTPLTPTRYATRCASTRVLPEPAPARMSSGPSVVVTARACSGLRRDDDALRERLGARGVAADLDGRPRRAIGTHLGQGREPVDVVRRIRARGRATTRAAPASDPSGRGPQGRAPARPAPVAPPAAGARLPSRSRRRWGRSPTDSSRGTIWIRGPHGATVPPIPASTGRGMQRGSPR